MTEMEIGQEDINQALQRCQTLLRGMTIGILAALGLIIVLTTISTGAFVQIGAKALFYLILLQLLISLFVWRRRVKWSKLSTSHDVSRKKPWPWYPWI
ncbi:MAG: hypothetical protein GKR89_36130 [Candidatus Latescibacteria bacterium]|nr:hypothetical protein [Candidatus Latescibacterota bacterium]